MGGKQKHFADGVITVRTGPPLLVHLYRVKEALLVRKVVSSGNLQRKAVSKDIFTGLGLT